jgi:hypothetical protein
VLDTSSSIASVSMPSKSRAPFVKAARLPSSQTLFDVTICEIEETVIEYRRKFQSIAAHISPQNQKLDATIINHYRQSLRDCNVVLQNSLELLSDRVFSRHHAQGGFGSIAAGLRATINEQIDKALCNERRLGELAATSGAIDLATGIRSSVDDTLSAVNQFCDSLKQVRKNSCQNKPISLVLGNPAEVSEDDAKNQLSRVLVRWWESSIETPGPMTIALVDVNRVRAESPDLDECSAKRLLKTLADCIASRKSNVRTGAMSFSLETSVNSGDGCCRAIAWSFAVIESSEGDAEAIIAAGLERGSSKTVSAIADTQPFASISKCESAIQNLQSDADERRRKPRYPFPHVQLVAPAAGTGLPNITAFTEMRCHDISENGFSYYAREMPSSSTVAVALGTCAPHIYMAARVAHFRRVQDGSVEQYIVGCQFTGRAMILSGGN